MSGEKTSEDVTAASVGSTDGFGDGCDHCDTFGGQKTYANQACLPLNGRVVCVDWCIHQIVAALNAGGVRTTACCCGHGRMPGRIDLEDGRILTISSPNKADMPTCSK
jgi:hypothetical protein